MGELGAELGKFFVVKEALENRLVPLPTVHLRPDVKEPLTKFIENRSLRLLHATQIGNLASILSHGLVPRSSARFASLDKVMTNDDNRTKHGAICFSLGWPNTRTLSTWGPIGKFAIIEVDPMILTKKPWFVFHTNSASKECLESFKESPINHCGPKALVELFEERSRTNTGREIIRSALGLTASMPNDPQAELIIDVEIEPAWIDRIILPTKGSLEEVQEIVLNPEWPELKCEPRAFAPRVDNHYWQRGERVVRSSKEHKKL